MAMPLLHNGQRYSDAWLCTYEVCMKYKIDPDLSTTVPRFRFEDNLECKRRLQQILLTDNRHRSRSQPQNQFQDGEFNAAAIAPDARNPLDRPIDRQPANPEISSNPAAADPSCLGHHTTNSNNNIKQEGSTRNRSRSHVNHHHQFNRIFSFLRLIMSFQQSTSKVKAAALWSKSKEDLLKQLGELKTDLSQLRIQKINSSGAKLNRIHDVRKSIARVLTVINLKQRSQLRLFYKNKKYLPLDLRAKQTRAIRRRLSPADAAKKLEKTKKRSTHFPQRKYAVKAN